MAYLKSKARRAFDAEIDKMISVISDTFSSPTTSTDTKQYVLACCVMLGTAKLEVYFEDFMGDWIKKVNALTHLQSSHLPNNLRALYLNQQFLNNAFRKIMTDNVDEGAYLDGISSNLSSDYFKLTDGTKNIPILHAKKIFERKKYPSTDNVKMLFRRVGINQIFAELSRRSKSDLQKELESFNDIRTEIAHIGILGTMTDTDIIKKLKGLRRIVQFMDKVLYDHIATHTTTATWAS